MSRFKKYDKLYRYIQKQITQSSENSLDSLREQLAELERQYKDGAHSAPAMFHAAVVPSPYIDKKRYEERKKALTDSILKKMAETITVEISSERFIDLLYSYIDKRGYAESDLYNKANVSKQVFSKIRQGTIPTISTVVKLALALECEPDELDSLLKTAGYALQESNAYDMLIRFIVNNKLFRSYEEYDKYLDYYEYFEAVRSKWPNHLNKYKDWFKDK